VKKCKGEKVQLKLGDIVVMKKPHPCGSKEFEITRLGVDYKLRCKGCGREIMIARIKADKSIKAVKNDENQDYG
jgi:hypothetical protein